MNYTSLTAYGPGKFDKLVDMVAYYISLDGTCETIGDIEPDGCTWTRVNGPIDPGDVPYPVCVQSLSDTDRQWIATHTGGAVVQEDDRGFVEVAWFESQPDLLAAWAELTSAAGQEAAKGGQQVGR